MLSNPYGLNPSGPTLHGIDVASPQGHNFDWKLAVADGVRFAWCKATQGAGVVDRTFKRNFSEARINGILVGAYHFFAADEPIMAQRDLYLTTVGSLAPEDLHPMIDVEVTRGQSPQKVIDGAREWCELIKVATGRKPVFYTFPSFFSNPVEHSNPKLRGLGNPDAPELTEYDLWISHFVVGTTDGKVYSVKSPTLPKPWQKKGWKVWQTSGNKGPRIPGIPFDVDRNVFWGTEEEFRDLFTNSNGVGLVKEPTLTIMPPEWQPQTSLETVLPDIFGKKPT